MKFSQSVSSILAALLGNPLGKVWVVSPSRRDVGISILGLESEKFVVTSIPRYWLHVMALSTDSVGRSDAFGERKVDVPLKVDRVQHVNPLLREHSDGGVGHT